jgi:hypothetical protein
VYFPNVEFLEADLGTSPSKIWLSIIDGREVLKEGLIKRIGMGEDTEIWDSNWLPRDGLLRPVTCVLDTNMAVPPQLVSELIDHSTVSWNKEKLQAVFLPMDVEAVLSIPLNTRRQTDFWLWHYGQREFSQCAQLIACLFRLKRGEHRG